MSSKTVQYSQADIFGYSNKLGKRSPKRNEEINIIFYDDGSQKAEKGIPESSTKAFSNFTNVMY